MDGGGGGLANVLQVRPDVVCSMRPGGGVAKTGSIVVTFLPRCKYTFNVNRKGKRKLWHNALNLAPNVQMENTLS